MERVNGKGKGKNEKNKYMEKVNGKSEWKI